MKRKLIKIFYFFKGKSYAKNIAVTVLLGALFVGFGILLQKVMSSNVNETILASAFGFAASNIIFYMFGMLSRIFEDSIKVNTRNADMFKIYSNPKYRKVVSFKKSEEVVCYNDLLINNNFEFEVDDNKDKMFELDGFVEQNYLALFGAHASSSKENNTTIRLDDIEKVQGKYIFHLSRSTFYNHLVTNRALDFQLSNGLTVRTYYEYGPNISSLKDSKLSNHIGINALVFLNDGHVIFPQRRRDSTISKNCITSSIATRLTFPFGKSVIDKKYLFEDCVYQGLQKRLFFDLNKLHKEDVEIKFLGVGQNIFEGGKPQMYFVVNLKNVNIKNIESYMYKLSVVDSKIDNDKRFHYAKYDELEFTKNEAVISLNSYNIKTKKYKSHKLTCERSLLANIWHYQQTIKKNLFMVDCFGVVTSSVLPVWFAKTFGKEIGKELSDYYCSRGDRGELSLKQIAISLASDYKMKSKCILKQWLKIALLNKPLVNYIRELKQNSEVVLASNAAEGLVESILKKHKLNKLFDKVFVSYKFKVCKPDIEYYKTIISSYDRAFDHYIMIDDRENNLIGLDKIGVKGIVYKDVPSLSKSVSEILNK